jgi:hypothetical protein
MLDTKPDEEPFQSNNLPHREQHTVNIINIVAFDGDLYHLIITHH